MSEVESLAHAFDLAGRKPLHIENIRKYARLIGRSIAGIFCGIADYGDLLFFAETTRYPLRNRVIVLLSSAANQAIAPNMDPVTNAQIWSPVLAARSGQARTGDQI